MWQFGETIGFWWNTAVLIEISTNFLKYKNSRNAFATILKKLSDYPVDLNDFAGRAHNKRQKNDSNTRTKQFREAFCQSETHHGRYSSAHFTKCAAANWLALISTKF